MKTITHKVWAFVLPMALMLPLLACIAGCGSSDSEPPNDPSYYKGEMKGKGAAGAGPAADGAGTQ
jgi:hypothetical protein